MLKASTGQLRLDLNEILYLFQQQIEIMLLRQIVKCYLKSCVPETIKMQMEGDHMYICAAINLCSPSSILFAKRERRCWSGPALSPQGHWSSNRNTSARTAHVAAQAELWHVRG